MSFSCLLIPGIKSLPVIDRDEAHFAQATRQMLQTHDFGKIRFQENTRYQKPPGINWLQAVSVKLFSTPDANIIWPYRVPSLISALATILLTYYFGLIMFSRKAGILAAVFLGSSALFVVESHMGVIDSALLLSVTVMQLSLWQIFSKKVVPPLWVALFWSAFSIGFLLKGVTPLVAILTIGTLCIVRKDKKWLKNLKFNIGLTFFAVSTLLWVFIVNHAENTNYLMQMFQKDLLPKLKGGHESHGKPAFFHLAILFFTFWPGSLFLPKAIGFVRQHFRHKKIMFLMCWIIPTWIFFEIMPTKLPQYVLPVFPAIAIISAQACLVMGRIRKNDMRFVLILATILFYPVIFAKILPAIDELWLTRNISNVTLQKYDVKYPIYVIGYNEPSLVFYFNTVDIVLNAESKINELKAGDFVLINVKNLSLFNTTQYQILEKFEGFNYSKGKWTQLILVKKL